MVFPDARVELLVGGTWTDITADVLTRDPITITRGRSNEGARTDPGRCTLTLNNTDGTYSPRNPRSPLYGLIGRNTQIRVGAMRTTTALLLSGGYAETPPSASTIVHGDIDIRVDASPRRWAAPRDEYTCLLGKFHESPPQYSVYVLLLDDRGRLWFKWETDDDVQLCGSTTAVPAADGQRLAVRVALDGDNGTGGHTVTFSTAPALAGPWTVLGSPVTATGTADLQESSGRIALGAAADYGYAPFDGRLHAAEVRDGIDGPLVAAPMFSEQPHAATEFDDALGLTWSLAGRADLVDRHIRFVGEVSAWPIHWGAGGHDVTTVVEAAGVLRRLGQGAKALESTLRRQVPTRSPLAYWPMEDLAGSQSASTPLPGASPLATSGLTWAVNDSLPSSAALPQVTPGATFSGQVPPPVGTATAWQFQMLYRINDVNPAAETLVRVLSSGTAAEWTVGQYESTSTLTARTATGAVLLDIDINLGLTLYGQWIQLGLFVEQQGSLVSWQISWRDIAGVVGAGGNVLTGVIGRPTGVASAPDGYPASLADMSIGHLALFADIDPTHYNGAIDSWNGELAGDRIRRLCEEERIGVYVPDYSVDHEHIGSQGQGTLLDLLTETAAADGGVLYEDRPRLGVAYRGRTSLYNQPPALALRYGIAREVAPPLLPVDDDQAVRNDVSVQRTAGAAVRAVLNDGPLSVQDPPAGIGRYDETVTLNLADDHRVAHHAGWRLHLGTWDGARYPSVHVRLHSAPHLIDAATAVDSGDRIAISNLPAWLPLDDVDLIVQGYTEILGPTTWDITYNCAPGGPWNLATVDDPMYGRADTAGSETAAAVTASATSLSVTTASGPLWTTASADCPFDIAVGGEVMTVTAISGSSSPQTFAVTRAVNGVTKPHAAGADVRLAHPAIAAL